MRADVRRFIAAGLFLALAAGAPLAAHAADPTPVETAPAAISSPAPIGTESDASSPEPTQPSPSVSTPAPTPTATEPSPTPDETDTITLKNAQLRWSLNALLHRKPHDGKNFLSAGLLADTQGQRMPEGLWKQAEGAVRIERASGSTYVPATWAGFGDGTDHQVVIDGGTGTVDASAQSARITWRGTFGVARYSGMTAFSVSDPALIVENGVGRLEGTLSGFGVSRDGNGSGNASGPIGPTTVVLADLGSVDLSNPAGLTKTPAFYGVRVNHPDQKVDAQGRWGAFPASFISFVDQVGQSPFWMTSGSDDAAKPGAPVAVSFDAAAPVVVTPPRVTPEKKKPKVKNPTKKAPPAKSAPAPQPVPAQVPVSALSRIAPPPAGAPSSVPVEAAFVNTASLTAATPTVLVDSDGGSSDLGWWIAAAFLLMSAAAVAAPSLIVRPRAA